MEKKKLVISRDVVFNEADFGQQKQPVEIKPDAGEEVDEAPEDLVAEQSEQSDPQGSVKQQEVRSQRIMVLMNMQMSQR